MEFGIEAFHRRQTALRLVQDDGDGLPGPQDHFIEIWSGKEAEAPAVEASLAAFYRGAFEGLLRRDGRGAWGGYALGTRVLHAAPEVRRRLLAHLGSRDLGAGGWLALERTAKARGDLEFGRTLNRLFREGGPARGCRRLPFPDVWGDPLFLEAKSPSLKTWYRMEGAALTEGERGELARALGYFVSVDLEAGVDPKALLQLGAWARDYHRQGLPLPPQIRIFQPIASGPDRTPGGSYRVETDTLSLPADAGPDAWAHEWSHFLLDALNDQNGLNSTFYEPNSFAELNIFDLNRCSTWESLSIYAGTCDRERRGTAMAGSKRAAEDPAETLAAVLEAGRGAALPSTLHLNLTEVYFLQKLQVAVYWSETEEVEIGPAELRDLRKTAQDFHRHLGRDVPAPPGPDPKISSRESLLDLAAWVRRLETEILPQAKRRRQEKLAWARGLLEALRPVDPDRGSPDPSRLYR
ncbi:hypothetical protein FBR05_11025 [Deltaproteobacteria bacterium PRO3]|nr:hypothetical protein [Deltaproteobacteria bacterium PRO3]